jgi:hypothetical protein
MSSHTHSLHHKHTPQSPQTPHGLINQIWFRRFEPIPGSVFSQPVAQVLSHSKMCAMQSIEVNSGCGIVCLFRYGSQRLQSQMSVIYLARRREGLFRVALGPVRKWPRPFASRRMARHDMRAGCSACPANQPGVANTWMRPGQEDG